MNKTPHQFERSNEQYIAPICASQKENIGYIQKAMGNSTDLVVREVQCLNEWSVALVYISGMVNVQILNEGVLPCLLQHRSVPEITSPIEKLNYIEQNVLTASEVTQLEDMEKLFQSLFSGSAILIIDGCVQALQIPAAGWEKRSVNEPTSQVVMKGPMQAFNENMRVNLALLRRRIKDPALRIEERQIGRLSNTDVAIVYLDHTVNPEVVNELRNRLDKINIDAILESGYIEEFIEDETFSVFPTVYNTERPDTVAAALLEGRVAVMVDGTPFVLLVPALLVHFFQSPEDYYQRFDISSFIRLIRFLAFFIALLAPSLYIAVTTYHQEILPMDILINLTAQREGVPFSAFVEALLMELTYEILREAGIRIPKAIGQAISIVGSLVIGQAAVEAQIVSAGMVIIVSITAIASYVIPEYSLAISVRMLRFFMMILAGVFGLFGILIGLLILITHLCSIRSFGVPYTAPLAPSTAADMKDTFLRVPWLYMKKRPLCTGTLNKTRQK